MGNMDPAWFGYAALLSLLAMGFLARIEFIRLALAIAALLALPFALFEWHSIGAAALPVAILALNLALPARRWYRAVGTHFTAEGLAPLGLHFSRLCATDARRLMPPGHWAAANAGAGLPPAT